MDATPIPFQQMRGFTLHNLILFGRILRGLGLDINSGRMIQVTQALEYIDMGKRDDFYHTLRSLLVTHHQDLEKFDQAFDLFWRKPKDGELDPKLKEMLVNKLKQQQNEPIVTPPPIDQPTNKPDEETQEADDDEIQEVIEVTRTYSAKEVLSQKDFAELSNDELVAVKRLISQLVWQLGERKTRRQRPGAGRTLDLRRTLRKSFRHGGEVLKWEQKSPKIKPRPLVILADISGSMERYTRLLTHFMYSLAEGMNQRVELFTFGTKLTRITRQLKHKDPDKAIDEVSSAVQDWSGGTRIGDILQTFNFDWSRRVLRGGAIVIIISDGWDRGDPELLGREMARLQRFSHRVIWLNPLLSSERYEPLTRGLKACMPFIDDFLPVHNLNSLEDLAQYLRALDERGHSSYKPNLKGSAFIGDKKG